MMAFDTVFTEVFGVLATELSEEAQPPVSFSHGGGHRFDGCVAHLSLSLVDSSNCIPPDGCGGATFKIPEKG